MKRTKIRLPDAINCSIQKEYTAVPNEIIRNSEISFKAKGVLSILLSNKEGWTSYQTTITKFAKESKGTIETAVKELEKAGYVARIRYRDIKTKTWRGSFWAYSDTKNNFDISNHLEALLNEGLEPHTKNPNVGLPNVAFCPLKKLIKKKTKENKTIKLHSLAKKKPKRVRRLKSSINKLETPKQTKPTKLELNETYKPFANKLKDIVQTQKNIKINGQKINNWCNSIRLLVDTDGISTKRINKVLRWYKDNVGGDYIPVIESGSSLREKFTRLEAAIERQKNPPKNNQKTQNNWGTHAHTDDRVDYSVQQLKNEKGEIIREAIPYDER